MCAQKQLTILFTSLVPVAGTLDLAREMLPDVRVVTIVDDSLLSDVLAAGHLTKSVTRRFCQYALAAEDGGQYALAAEDGGADLILSQCSSVGEAVDVARELLRTPILKIDEPMAEEAVTHGPRVVVAATLPTTLGPTCRLIESTAARLGAEVRITRVLAEGAFDLLQAGDTAGHNQMVLDAIAPERDKADVIVLAQGSMAVLAPTLADWGIPALTSPRLGMLRAREMLDAL